MREELELFYITRLLGLRALVIPLTGEGTTMLFALEMELISPVLIATAVPVLVAVQEVTTLVLVVHRPTSTPRKPVCRILAFPPIWLDVLLAKLDLKSPKSVVYPDLASVSRKRLTTRPVKGCLLSRERLKRMKRHCTCFIINWR